MNEYLLTIGAIQPIAYFSIGFLFATVLGAVVVPVLSRRAARVAEQRRKAAVRLLTKIRAKKNELSADLAKSTRSFETTVEELKDTIGRQRADLGRCGDRMNHLIAEGNALKMEVDALRSQALPSADAPSLQPSKSKPGPMFLPLEPDERARLAETRSSQSGKSETQEQNPVLDLRAVLKSKTG
jgi:regulator of replication initiation timing